MKTIIILILLIILPSCMSSSPRKNLIKQKPVVQAGHTSAAAKHDFILMIPAGYLFPIDVVFNSALFAQQGKAKTKLRLNRDLYIYNQWASYDGKHWNKLNELFAANLSADLKSKGGAITIILKQHKKAGF